MRPRPVIGSEKVEEQYPPLTLGTLASIGTRLALIVGAVLSGVAIWLGRNAEIDTTTDFSRPAAFAPNSPKVNSPGLLPDRTHHGTLNQPRNLNGLIVIILYYFNVSPEMGTPHALELLRMKPADATPKKIAELLDLPEEQVTLDRPLAELLVAEIDPEAKAKLIEELATESATPREIQTAARSLGMEAEELFILSARSCNAPHASAGTPRPSGAGGPSRGPSLCMELGFGPKSSIA